MEPLPPVNHVFIDFENVHEFDLGVIGARTVSLTLLAGAKQTKLSAALVEKLLQHAASVQLVRLASSGKNALDFTLAYYVGRAAAADPGGYFHIISRDTGFDPLVDHLNSRSIRAWRHGDLSTLLIQGMTGIAPPLPSPPPQPMAPPGLAAPAKPKPLPKPKAPPKRKMAPKPKAVVSSRELRKAAVLELLNKVPANRPKKHSKLVSHLVAHFGKTGSEAEIRAVIEDLRTGGHFAIGENGAITYGAALK